MGRPAVPRAAGRRAGRAGKRTTAGEEDIVVAVTVIVEDHHAAAIRFAGEPIGYCVLSRIERQVAAHFESLR